MSSESPQRPGGDAEPQPQSPGSPRNIILPWGSPMLPRRHRTYSMNERVKVAPTCKGDVKSFCRQKGHGFIIARDDHGKATDEELFVHISDIEGAYVPREGDEVTFKKMLVPPKNIKYMAVGVKITHLKEGVSHEKWDEIQSQKGTPAS